MSKRVWSALGLSVLLMALGSMRALAEQSAAATQQASTQPATTSGGAAAAPDVQQRKLKVGVLVSYYTATGPSRIGRPYSYEHANVADALRDPSVQLFPLIERNSETDEALAKVIEEKFPESENQAYFADDVDSLKSLDAIVIHRAPNLNTEVLDGVGEAVAGGTGLLVIGPVGVNDPGYKEPLNNLLGMDDDTNYAYVGEPQDVEILAADDPLLKDLGDAAAWVAQPNGVMGTLKEGGKPLIKLQSTDALLPRNQRDGDFLLLYQTHVGNGAVIVCNWSGVVPDAAANATEPGFYVRCLQRLVALRK